MHVTRVLAAALSLAAGLAVSAAQPALAADETISVNFATAAAAPIGRPAGSTA